MAHVVLGLQIGGLEMVVANLLERLADSRDIESSVFCLDSLGPLTDRVKALGGVVRLIERKTGRDWRLPARLVDAVREHGVAVLHAHNFTPFVYACAAGRLGHVPVIGTFHNTHLARWPAKRILTLKALSFASAGLVAVTRQTQAVMEGMLPRATRRRLTVIPNGIQTDRFRTLSPAERSGRRAQLGLPADAHVIGSVGRLSPEKDYAMLLRAFARLRSADPRTTLVLVGDGPERGLLEQLAASLDVVEHVRFLGARDDIDQILPAFEVFALSSITEGASIALLEAMATALPIVATRVGGTPDLVDHEDQALLVEAKQPEAMADSLRRVLSDAALAARLGAAARERAVSRYSLEHMGDAYAALYRSAVRSR